MNTFSCDEARCRLAALQDRELPAGEASAVDAHLAACSECRREERELSNAWLAFRQAHDAPGVPAALSVNPFARREASFGWPALRNSFAAAFACVALAFAASPRACTDATPLWSPAVEIAAFRDLGSAELLVAREPSPEPMLDFK